jgi:hypothetical protein
MENIAMTIKERINTAFAAGKSSVPLWEESDDVFGYSGGYDHVAYTPLLTRIPDDERRIGKWNVRLHFPVRGCGGAAKQGFATLRTAFAEPGMNV